MNSKKEYIVLVIIGLAIIFLPTITYYVVFVVADFYVQATHNYGGWDINPHRAGLIGGVLVLIVLIYALLKMILGDLLDL